MSFCLVVTKRRVSLQSNNTKNSNEMNKKEFTPKATAAIQAFLDTCFEMGLSAEKTKQLISSKEGIDAMNSAIS